MQLTAVQSRDAVDALQALQVSGVQGTLRECAEFFISHRRPDSNAETVETWFNRYMDRLTAPDDGSSPARRRTLVAKRNRIQPFVERCGSNPVSEITDDDIQDFLDWTGADGRNLLNFKIEVQSLFNFVEKQSAGAFVNRVARFPQKKRKETPPATIVTPETAKRYLHAMEIRCPQSALVMALGCFAGIRTSELTNSYGPGLEWQHIDFGEQRIFLPASITKTRRRREVPICPNLMQWLTKYRLGPEGTASTGKIAPSPATVTRRRAAVAKATGIQWPSNAARHSFGTYFGRLHGHREAADCMGHVGSMQIFEDHYRGAAVKKAAAEKYFSIAPHLHVEASDADRRPYNPEDFLRSLLGDGTAVE